MNLEWLNWFGIDYLYSPDKRVFAGYLLFAILTGLFIGHLTRQPRSEWLSKDIWWHPSARLDYRYFVVISFIKLALIYPVMWRHRLFSNLTSMPVIGPSWVRLVGGTY